MDHGIFRMDHGWTALNGSQMDCLEWIIDGMFRMDHRWTVQNGSQMECLEWIIDGVFRMDHGWNVQNGSWKDSFDPFTASKYMQCDSLAV